MKTLKPHRTDGVSLTFAILFLGVVALWLTGEKIDLGLPTAGWLVAGALIFFGALGLLGTIRSARRPHGPGQSSDGPGDPDAD